MGKHYNRKSQEKLLVDLRKEIGVSGVSIQSLSDYQLMTEINKHLSSLNLITYTEEELEMDLN
jgi:hypothetical protein